MTNKIIKPTTENWCADENPPGTEVTICGRDEYSGKGSCGLRNPNGWWMTESCQTDVYLFDSTFQAIVFATLRGWKIVEDEFQ